MISHCCGQRLKRFSREGALQHKWECLECGKIYTQRSRQRGQETVIVDLKRGVSKIRFINAIKNLGTVR